MVHCSTMHGGLLSAIGLIGLWTRTQPAATKGNCEMVNLLYIYSKDISHGEVWLVVASQILEISTKLL